MQTRTQTEQTALSARQVAWRVTRLNLRAQLDYRAEFLIMIAIGAIWQVSIIVFATVLLGRFSGMGDWPSDAVLMIAAMRMLSHGLFVLFFGRVSYLSQLVQEGQVDGYLLRPMPVHRQVQLAFFPTNAIGDLLVGASMFVGAVVTVQLRWTALHVVYVAAAVLGGMLVEAAIHTALSAFHLHYPGAAAWTHWVQELLETFGNYPLKILPGLFEGLFTFVLPLAFVAYLPAAVLTGHTHGLLVPWSVAAAAPLLGLAFYLLSRLLWNAGLSRYTGVNG